MNMILPRLFGVLFVLASFSAEADTQRVSVALRTPSDFVAKTCPSPVWKGTSVSWKGVTDVREEKEIGKQSKKKGKDLVFVDADPPMATVIDSALKELFPACGLKIVSGSKFDVEMSGEVSEFYAGVEKKLLTGKGMARSNLLFRLKRPGSNIDQTVEVGYEIESKKIRQKDIRQLEKTLNELLSRTLEQIPKLDGFKGF